MQLHQLLRRFGRALALLVLFDIFGVGLMLFAEFVAFVDRVWETSSLLGYAVWFVVGVFSGVCNYPLDDPESEAGRRDGVAALASTAAAALVLGCIASFFWSSSDSTEPVAPDHFGVTITYLVTSVLTVAAARFVLFRRQPARLGAMPRLDAEVATYDDPKDLERALARAGEVAVRADATESFRPAGVGTTVAFAFGIPVLLFLDVGIFVLGPFDVFDRFTGPLLGCAVIGGLGWGLAAARFEQARTWLLGAHAPLLIGTVFYFFGLLPGALLAMFGAPAWLSENTPFAGFVLGFVLGLVALGGGIHGSGCQTLRRWSPRRAAK